MAETATLGTVIFFVLFVPLAWHITQLVLGFEYASDTCDVDLDYWNQVGGGVGIGFVGLAMVTALFLICSEKAGAPLVIFVGFYAVWQFAWAIYGMTLLFTDDGLKCKLRDRGHDRSLWIYSLVNVMLTTGGIIGGASGGAGKGK